MVEEPSIRSGHGFDNLKLVTRWVTATCSKQNMVEEPSIRGGHGFDNLKLVTRRVTVTCSNMKFNYLCGSCTLLSMFFSWAPDTHHTCTCACTYSIMWVLHVTK